MRIDSVNLLSYGPFQDTSLDLTEPAAGLAVVLGPNEAGKSTALRALTAVLYGFARGTTDDFGRGRANLKVGARLRGADGSVLNLVRQGGGRSSLVDASGEPLDEVVLSALLGGADRALFSSLFTIDHEGLHSGSQDLLDADGDLGRLVFGASLGGSGLRAVMARLDARAGGLFKPQGRTQTIPESLGRFRSLRGEVKALQTKSREWDQCRQAREAAEARVEELHTSLSEGRIERDGLVRLRATLPLLAVRADAIIRLAELESEGPVPPMAWAERCEELLANQVEAADRRDEQAAAVGRLETQLANIDVPLALLDGAARIDRLQQGTDRYRTDSEHLPQREGELAILVANIEMLLRRLGLTVDQAAGVTDAQLANVEQLADRHGAVHTEATRSARELQNVVELLNRLTVEIEGLPGEVDVGPLRQRADAANTAAVFLAGSAGEAAELDSLAGDLIVGLARLSLTPVTNIEMMATPTGAAVQSHTDGRATLIAKITGLEGRLEEYRVEMERIEAEKVEVAKGPGVPDPEAVVVARVRRQQAWQLVRAAWLDEDASSVNVVEWPASVDLPVAYEAAVVAADGAADVRFDHAANVQQLLGFAQQHHETSEKHQRTGVELGTARMELDALDVAWAELWTSAGFPRVEPASAASYLEEIGRLQTSAADMRRRRNSLAALETDAAKHYEGVAAKLRALGIEPAHDQLTALLVQVQEVIDAEKDVAVVRADLGRQHSGADGSRVDRANAAGISTGALKDWTVSWRVATGVINLAAETSIEVARGVVAQLRELRNTQHSADVLRSRVDGIRRDMRQFEEAARSLLADLATDVAGDDLLDGLAHVKLLLDGARDRFARYQTFKSQLDDARNAHDEAQQRADDLAVELTGQRRIASIEPDEPLATFIARTRAAEVQQSRRDTTEARLLAQGVGLGIEAIAAAAEVYDGDGVKVDAAEAERSETIETLQRDYGLASEALNEARRAFEEIDGSDRAANVEQAAEVELAGLATAVDSYARVVMAGEVLRRVVGDYGREYQAPIVDRAIALFTKLTEGAFSGLIVDVDGEQRLQASRRNGQFLDLDELSDGTIDQLYLALRLAAIEQHLDRVTEPLPVVLDDLLVNFDDDRASAAIRVLADLGRRTQVLLFTHHRHVVDLAQNACDADALHVFELTPRAHDVTATVAAKPIRVSRALSSSVTKGTYNDAVLDALRRAGEPLGRGEIVERTGLGVADWKETIISLIESGAVLQTGAKRGTRYKLP